MYVNASLMLMQGWSTDFACSQPRESALPCFVQPRHEPTKGILVKMGIEGFVDPRVHEFVRRANQGHPHGNDQKTTLWVRIRGHNHYCDHTIIVCLTIVTTLLLCASQLCAAHYCVPHNSDHTIIVCLTTSERLYKEGMMTRPFITRIQTVQPLRAPHMRLCAHASRNSGGTEAHLVSPRD